MAPIVVDQDAPLVRAGDVRARRPELDVRGAESPSALVEMLADAADPVVFVSMNSAWRDDYLDALSPGDWVATATAGYDRFPVEAFAERGIAFTNAPGVGAPAVAEHVFATALYFTRWLDTYRAQQRAHVWQRRREGLTDLSGETCCVVGLGRIGEQVAVRARAFGMTVRGVKRTVSGYDGAADEVVPPAELRRALDGASLLVLCVPLTEATRGLVGSAELAACDDGAIVVNVARGPVLRTESLVEALDAGTVRAAALDVVEGEPLGPDSPLWGREDVLLTPHIGGSSDKYTDRLLDLLFAEYDRWRAGEPLHHQVV